MAAIVDENLPAGLHELASCDSLQVEMSVTCCKSWYVVTSPSQGVVFTSKHHTNYKNQLLNAHQTPIIDFTMKNNVKMVMTFPEQRLGLMKVEKGVVFDENDLPLLRFLMPTHTFTHTSRVFKILGPGDLEVGELKMEALGEWDIQFPLDMELKYKAAILIGCLNFDILIRHQSLNG